MQGGKVKAINMLGCGTSYLVSSLTRVPFVPHMPAAISFELTNHCNLKCLECASGSGAMKRKRGFMETGIYFKTVRELSPYLWFINLYFQGEPMLHPEFFSFTGAAGSAGITVSTNGHYLSPENCEKLAHSGISRLIVSLDGMDQETYSQYRKGGDLNRVLEGIRNVSEAVRRDKSGLKLELQFLVNNYNQHQVGQVRRFARESGAVLRLKSMQVLNIDEAAKWMPGDERFRRYRNEGESHVLKSRLPDRCLRLWYNPVITWDGKVIPCCFDKDADYVMGDLKKDSFREIWHGKLYQDFRKQVLTGRKSIPMCRNCTSGLKGVRY